jgi:excisionase family DNA binding protein
VSQTSIPKNVTRMAYGVHELAALLGNSTSFWRKQIRERRLRATRLGRRVVVTVDDLDAYLLGCKGAVAKSQ